MLLLEGGFFRVYQPSAASWKGGWFGLAGVLQVELQKLHLGILDAIDFLEFFLVPIWAHTHTLQQQQYDLAEVTYKYRLFRTATTTRQVVRLLIVHARGPPAKVKRDARHALRLIWVKVMAYKVRESIRWGDQLILLASERASETCFAPSLLWRCGAIQFPNRRFCLLHWKTTGAV